MDDPPRTRPARQAAEQALVRVVHHYGATPEFVLLGGLVPELLCSASDALHAGTTDVDVQVDLEIAVGAVNTARLERALANAEFVVDPGRVWRWEAEIEDRKAIVKFELLADLAPEPTGVVLSFGSCEALDAVNLRGTGFAARDYAPLPIKAKVGGVRYEANINVAGLAGFLLAKVAAAYGRRKPKDWYDISFVLLHNARAVRKPRLTRYEVASGQRSSALPARLLTTSRRTSPHQTPKDRMPTPHSS